MALAVPELVRRTLTGARRRLAPVLRSPRHEPLVSVIVPVYNVRDYVEECLRSVLGQTHRNLEIIVVDDGGTDDSMAVARAVCAGDRRVRFISQPNAGLGAARNTGVRAAKSAYLRFIDSDDVLPPDSIALLVASLEQTASDFAVGNLRRLDGDRTWVPGWAKEVHRVDRLGIVLADLPDVLKDPFAHNKLFRAEFFHRVVGGFPEGVRYEDQEPSARAYVSGRFDVLRSVVYDWRIRGDGTSITQQKSDPADLHDRLQVKNRVAMIIAEQADDDVRRRWLAKAVGFDLRPYYEQVPRTGPEFWEQLRSGLLSFVGLVDEQIWQQVPMIDRLLALATVEGHRDDVVALLTKREDYGWQLPGRAAGGQALLETSYLSGMRLRPGPALRRFAPSDNGVRALVEAVRFEADRLVVEGFAHLRAVDLTDAEQQLELWLVNASTGERRPLDVTPRFTPTADRESGDSWNSFARSGFSASVSLDGWPRPDAEVWRLVLRLEVGGMIAEQVLASIDRRRAIARLPFGPMVPGEGRWTLVQDDVEGLGVRWVPLDPARLLDARVTSGRVHLVVDAAQPTTIEASAADSSTLTFAPTSVSGTSYHFVVALPQGDQRVDWQLRTSSVSGRGRLFWPASSDDLAVRADEVGTPRLQCSREGTLRVRCSPLAAVLTEVGLETRASDEVLLLVGRTSPSRGARWSVAVVGRSTATPEHPVVVDDEGPFAVAVPLRDTTGRTITEGTLELRLTRADRGSELSVMLRPSFALTAAFPYEMQTARRAVTVDGSSRGAARVRLRRPYTDAERGRLAQRRLHDLAARPGRQPARPTVVFESFGGRTAADSPLALFTELRDRHPDWDLWWSVAELTTPVPTGATALLQHSRQWVEVVRSATHLVNNANFPHYFRKHDGQHYLQTWHGTPLKKIGRDVPLTSLSLSYRSLMEREVQQWDQLLAQSPWAGEVLANAFGYQGPVLDRGYPRDDVLADSNTRRNEVRQELGLGDGSHVVLYAPTWRDDARTAGGGYALVSHLDFAAAQQTLSNVTFLLRGHSNTTSAGVQDGAVIDVTAYPDVNDLMLAADALVTDYSSVMFDFCVTGKPLYFLVPDLDRYGTQTRGFYFDLADAAPGPVCLDQAALVDALADRASYAERWGERYAAFARRFAPFDDGRSTQRVVDAVWGPESAL